MTITGPEHRMRRYCRRITDAAGLIAISVGALVLAGWAWDITLFLSVLPGYATMKPNTAACFLLSGAALWLLHSVTTESRAAKARRLAGRAIAALVAVVGFTTAAQALLGGDLGIDWVLFPDRLRATPIIHPGRMSFATAVNFFLLGIALFSMDARSSRLRRVLPSLALLVGAVALIPLLGYVYSVTALYQFFPYQSLALHTSLTFIVLSVGALCARPDHGAAATITSESLGGMMARRLLPFVIVLPIVLEWGATAAERAGLYQAELGDALVATATIFIIAAVVWLSAGSLNRVDAVRRRAETSLRDSESRLRAIIQTEPECVKLVNAQGMLLEMNPAGLSMVEADSALQVIGRNILPLVDERFRTAFQNLHQRVFHGESGRLEFEIVGLKGTRRWVESIATPLCDADGRVTAALSVTRDITERKQAETDRLRLEHQLQQSQKLQALGTLAGGVAHDFNNILTIIAGNADLASASVPPDNPARGHLREIEKAGARAADLVKQILLFSRPQESRVQPVSLQSAVDDALNLLRATLPAAIEIRTRYAPVLPKVLADPVQVRQVMMNLATNAAYAMRGCGGVLEVRLDTVTIGDDAVPNLAHLRHGLYVKLSVSDNGCGMDADTLERVFEPFFTTKPPGQGTGLGLSVVHGIMSSHHGAIAVRSEIGRGTTFDLYFPVAEALSRDTRPARTDPAPGRGEHVLLVDDEEALVLLMTRFLEKERYRVTGYTDPARALDAFQADPDAFDLVVTDVSMPGMSGQDLARHILLIRPSVPVVMTSGYVEADDQAAARRLGVRELILKPNTIRELVATVSRLLNKDKARRTAQP